MKLRYATLISLSLHGLLAPTGAWAQAPTMVAVLPAANAASVAPTAPLSLTFSQPLTAASAGALRVFGNQRGGLRSRGATPAEVVGSTLRFVPSAHAYLPGETVRYTLTTAAATLAGDTLARPLVGQFTAAVGGTGTGYFEPGRPANVGSLSYSVALGDADNDGDLDVFVAQGGSSTVQVRLNRGDGTFSGSAAVVGGYNPTALALADVNGDGALDMLAANSFSADVTVSLNDGTGQFGQSTLVAVNSLPTSLAVADIDGDGDLDLLVPNAGTASVSILFNDGGGRFGGKQELALWPTITGGQSFAIAVGDVDGDGDVDLAVPNTSSLSVTIGLNDGHGDFRNLRLVNVGKSSRSVALADLDGDGDLDLLASYDYYPTLSTRFNAGDGTFGGGQEFPMRTIGGRMTMGDLDGDGSLDVAVVSLYDTTLTVGFNDGRGGFGRQLALAAGKQASGITSGDVDGDGDLDLLVANCTPQGGLTVLLNTVPPLATDPLVLFPNPAREVVQLVSPAPHTPVAVFNLLGRQVLAATTDAAGAATLRLPASLTAGFYLVQVGAHTQRLLLH